MKIIWLINKFLFHDETIEMLPLIDEKIVSFIPIN